MAFLPKTPGYLHLSPPLGPSLQLTASWPPWGQFSNSKTARNSTHGSWPQGSGKCCLLPMSCPHWAPGGMQIVHILKAGNQSSTMHNSPVALSHGQHHCVMSGESQQSALEGNNSKSKWERPCAGDSGIPSLLLSVTTIGWM